MQTTISSSSLEKAKILAKCMQIQDELLDKALASISKYISKQLPKKKALRKKKVVVASASTTLSADWRKPLCRNTVVDAMSASATSNLLVRLLAQFKEKTPKN